eukprot:TRINITY_DN2515_c0_g1_i13.p1 TRINITY_DN2515_c0_g1~~TRINITY_DN2515_c0_g1_i13.p1  ORF type:complete len:942 (+),score=163.11 TRINITY_DN2515_c0_g1_i13:55-2880(+)
MANVFEMNVSDNFSTLFISDSGFTPLPTDSHSSDFLTLPAQVNETTRSITNETSTSAKIGLDLQFLVEAKRSKYCLDTDPLTLRFIDEGIERRYRAFFSRKYAKSLYRMSAVAFVFCSIFVLTWSASNMEFFFFAITSFTAAILWCGWMCITFRSDDKLVRNYMKLQKTVFIIFRAAFLMERFPSRTEISMNSFYFLLILSLNIVPGDYHTSKIYTVATGLLLFFGTLAFQPIAIVARVIIPYILSATLSLFELKHIEITDRKVFETIMILEDNLEQIQRQRSKIMRLLTDSMPNQHRHAFIHEPWTLTHLPALSETTILTIRFRWLKRKDLEKYKTLFKLSGEIHEKVVALSRKFGITRVKSQGTWMMFCNKVTEEDGTCRPSDLCRFASEVVECSDILVSALSRHVTFQAGIATGPALSGVVDCSRRVFDLIGESAERSMHLSRMADTGYIYIDERTRNCIKMENFRLARVDDVNNTLGEKQGCVFTLKSLLSYENSLSHTAKTEQKSNQDQKSTRQTGEEIYKQLVAREVIKSRKFFLKVFPHYEFDRAKEQEFLKYMSESDSISRLRATAFYLVFASLLHGFVHLIVYDEIGVPLHDWQSFFIVGQYFILAPILALFASYTSLVPKQQYDSHLPVLQRGVKVLQSVYLLFSLMRIGFLCSQSQYTFHYQSKSHIRPILYLEALDVIRTMTMQNTQKSVTLYKIMLSVALLDILCSQIFMSNLGLTLFGALYFNMTIFWTAFLVLFTFLATKERINREQFLHSQILQQKNVDIEHEVEVAEQTLFSIVPKELYDLIVSKSSPYEHYPDTIIACINFAHYHLLLSSARDDAFSFLKEIYERIEVLCQVHQVRFLKSTSQTFHIAKVVTDSAQDAFYDVTRFSFQILELCKCLKLQASGDFESQHLGAQAYITRGDVCCGMIGNKVLVFDVTGHAGSKME